MKGYVVYDSAFGNTQAVAEAIAQGLKPIRAAAVSVTDFKPGSLAGGDLLVVRSPIISRPTPFYIQGTEGPLRAGELDRAATWAKNLASPLEQKATP